MAGFWKLEETRLVQYRQIVSAANADTVDFAGAQPPAGKLWIVLGFGYRPSVAETQVVSFNKACASGHIVGLLNPLSLNLNPTYATFIEQGMEYMLMPGEYVQVNRVTHTAASTMLINMEFIEIDQPLYTYEEPQVVKRQQRAISSIRTRLGGAVGGGGVSPRTSGSGRGGGGTPLPV